MVRMVSARGLLHHSRLCGSVAELNAGTWVASGESTAAVMPSCCDDANRRKARHNGSRSASWQWCNERRSNHPAPPYENKVRSGADQNKWAALLTEENCCNTRQKLEWEPKSCRLVAWNASQFCSSLGGRGLLVLGDSVSWQWFTELVRAIHWGLYLTQPDALAECLEKLTMASADTLVGKQLGGNSWNRGLEFTKWIRLFKPDIVIAGTGPHIYGEENYIWALATIAESLASLRTELGATAPTFIWQTIPGAGCGPEALKALPSQSTPHFWLNYNTTAYGALFNYPTFEARNSFAKAFWASRATSHGAVVLDLEPLHYRVDAHKANPLEIDLREARREGMRNPADLGAPFPIPQRPVFVNHDCMHYCQPGALHLIPRLLLHLLETSPALAIPQRSGSHRHEAVWSRPPESAIRDVLNITT